MDYDTSFDVKGSMVVCFIFASLNVLKEILQLIFYKHRYFLNPVNYMEWIMYVCVFIFASPTDQKIAVKTSLQWKACSVALLLAWINLVLYLRRIAAYGVYILMMEKICERLIKVLSLLILFFVAFAAAFTPIMNDKQGFTNFGLSMLTSAVMTTGEIDFKETFLGEADPDYETFHWLKLALLVAFLVIMPVILMNLILALVIGDTTSIMNQAKMRKHIETAKMIIDLERKRFAVPSWFMPQMLATLEERPNKPVHILRSTWEYVCYGPDFVYDEDTKAQQETRVNENVEARLVMIVDMMKEMQDRMTAMQKELADTRETHDTTKETTKSGGTGSEERSYNEQKGSRENKNRDSGEDFFPEELHVEEEKDRENDKEFMEIKELYKKIPDDIEDYHISS